VLKYATAEVLSVDWHRQPGIRDGRQFKVAHRHEFQYTPKHGMLYVRSRMISSRCNDNFDEFPAEEIKKGYKTFIGKPVFVNHHNDDHRRMRGLIIDAALHEDWNPDGTPDTWVEGLMEIDGLKYPKLAQAIIAGHIERTSMGVDVKYSVCSVCNHKATTPLEYCAHVPGMKGKTHYRVTASGGRIGSLIRETCYGLSFFENSLLVEPPADPTAIVWGVQPGPGLEHMLPRTASLDLRDQRLRDTELLRESGVGEIQGPDLSHLSFDQLGLRVAGTGQAPAPGNHVSRVVGRSAQHPVQGMLAQGEVAPVSDYLTGRDGANELRVSPSVGSYRTSPNIGQGESAVSRSLENSSDPRPAGIRSTAGVHVGEVALHLGHASEPTPTAYTASYPSGWPPAQKAVVPVDPRSLVLRTGSLKLVQATQCLACRCRDTVADLQGNAECFGCGHFWHEGHKQAALQAEAAKYDTPEEHPWFQEHPVHHSNIISHWNEATPDEKASGERWYPDAHLVAQGLASLADKRGQSHPHGNVHLAAGVLANHSPQNGWVGNMHDAARVLHEGKGLGGKGSGVFASEKQRQNDEDMLGGKAYHEVLRGPKINDFAHLIEHGGDEDKNVPHVVIDRHALGVAAGRNLTDKEYGAAPMSGSRRADGTLNRRYYDHVVNQYHEAGKHISEKEGREIPGHAVQAVTWLVRQRKNQEAERARAAGGADSRLDRGREKNRSNTEQKWNDFRQQYLPDMGKGPGTGYQASRRAAGLRGDLPEGLTFQHVDRGDSHKVMAIHPEDGQIGQLSWFKQQGYGHKAGEVDGIEVDPQYHRQGVASAMWEHAHALGVHPKPRHSSEQTEEGKAWAHHVGTAHVAYGETKAPAEVDTLRDENCPVCGEDEAWDGTMCKVCGFVAPPKQFQDPDLSVARQLDLRKQQQEFDDSIVPNPDQGGLMGDEQPELVCNNCGMAFPAAEPMSVDTDDPQAGVDPMESDDPETEMEGTETGQASEGDVCPNCGKGVLVSGAELAEEEGGVPPEEGEEDPDAPPSDEDEDGDGISDDEEAPEDTEEDQPYGVDPRELGDPDNEDDQDDEDDSDDDEDDKPAKGKQFPPKK
jgi:hypothetical protein